MSWDPFLMKILLKKEVCRSHEQCTGPTENALLKKKKKKKNADVLSKQILSDKGLEP